MVGMVRRAVIMVSVLLSAVGASPPGAARAEPSSALDDLVDAAAQRLQTADAVAASKWLTGGPITDPARVQQVLAAVTAEAQAAGVPPDYAAAVFTDQINATEGVQYSRFSWWKFDPSTAPGSAPDLAASRSVIDGLNHEMVAQIGRQWPVLQSPDCAAALSAAKNTVADARGLDALYRQALDAATRSYCRG